MRGAMLTAALATPLPAPNEEQEVGGAASGGAASGVDQSDADAATPQDT